MTDTTAFALDLARQAGTILCHRFARPFEVQHKGTIDLVTTADLEADRAIVAAIRKHFPDHGLLTEESGEFASPSEYTWLVDPLDGTTNFAHCYPVFAVSIGLRRGNEIVLGVVYDPMRDEMFWAEKGAGAFLGQARLAVSATGSLVAALVTTGFPYAIATNPDNNLAEFVRLVPKLQSVRASGSAALDLAYVAAGRLDAYWELTLSPWDMAAGWLLVTEAGGRVTDLTGEAYVFGARGILVSNGVLHEALRRVLAL